MSAQIKSVAYLSIFLAMMLLSIQLYMLYLKNNQRVTSRSKLMTWREIAVWCYPRLTQVPIVRGYMKHIRLRLSLIHSLEEEALCAQTTSVMFIVMAVVVSIGFALSMVIHSLHLWLVTICVLYFISETVVDFFVNRLNSRLLHQLIGFIGALRTHYFESYMVDEAFYSALQQCDANRHTIMYHQGMQIYEILIASDGEESLERYYQVAPNHYVKLLAGMAFMTKEYGDARVDEASVFAKGLNLATQELRDEVMSREKLNFALKSMNFVALMPLFSLGPLRDWASASFMPLERFYSGPLGFVAEMTVLIIILLAYIILRRVQKFHDDASQGPLDQFVHEGLNRSLKGLAKKITPKVRSSGAQRYQKSQLKALHAESLESFYLRKLYTSGFCAVVIIVLIGVMLLMSIRSVLYNPTLIDGYLGGELSAEAIRDAKKITDLDRMLLKEMKRPITDEALKSRIVTLYGVSENQTNPTRMRLMQKMKALDEIGLNGYHAALIYLSGLFGWLMPNAMLFLKKRLIEMHTLTEIGKFQLVILVLMHVQHMTVDQVLVWLEKFSLVFKEPLQRAILDYDAGALAALENLRHASTHPDYQKLIYQLCVSCENLALSKAFEELESEKLYYQEKRRIANERSVNEKIQLGQMIGFLPIYATIALYFMVPMVYASTSEMQLYFEKLAM